MCHSRNRQNQMPARTMNLRSVTRQCGRQTPCPLGPLLTACPDHLSHLSRPPGGPRGRDSSPLSLPSGTAPSPHPGLPESCGTAHKPQGWELGQKKGVSRAYKLHLQWEVGEKQIVSGPELSKNSQLCWLLWQPPAQRARMGEGTQEPPEFRSRKGPRVARGYRLLSLGGQVPLL